jgi:hypothetical protein
MMIESKNNEIATDVYCWTTVGKQREAWYKGWNIKKSKNSRLGLSVSPN